ncbi:hypothetical protein TD95_005354, partial [Thielaviopsis punctulata]
YADPAVQTVHLIGSWDNFARAYALTRDVRRHPNLWKGCFSFDDIVCDALPFDSSPPPPPPSSSSPPVSPKKRSGGLKMGSTYYYYYELDGAVETHDPAHPSTTTCPYLPGQTVNSLVVPIEKSFRDRSVSMSSLRQADWTTMRPSDRFVAPRPAPSPSPSPGPQTMAQRLATALPRPGSSHVGRNALRHKASSRSLSPAPSWRRFFRGLRERDRSQDRADRHLEDNDRLRASRPSAPRSVSYSISSVPSDLAMSASASHASSPMHPATPVYDYNTYIDVDADEPYQRSTSRQSTRSRDISPESLRRFLVDDMPARSASSMSTSHPLANEIQLQPDVTVTPANDDNDNNNNDDNDDDDDDDDNEMSDTGSVYCASNAAPPALAPPPMSIGSFSRPTSSRSNRSFTLPQPSTSPLATAPILVRAPAAQPDADEEMDDDNFASPVMPDVSSFATFLSPAPPTKRSIPAPLAPTRLSGSYSMAGVLRSPIFAPSDADALLTPTPGLTNSSAEPSPLDAAPQWDRGHASHASLSSLSTISAADDEHDDQEMHVPVNLAAAYGGLYLRAATPTGHEGPAQQQQQQQETLGKEQVSAARWVPGVINL